MTRYEITEAAMDELLNKLTDIGKVTSPAAQMQGMLDLKSIIDGVFDKAFALGGNGGTPIVHFPIADTSGFAQTKGIKKHKRHGRR